MNKLHSDITNAKKLARIWRRLANGALTIEDIEQEILLAQIEFDCGIRAKDPRQHPGLIYCQIASAHAQISVGGSVDRSEEGLDSHAVIAGAGIEHIDPVLLLEISQIEDGSENEMGLTEVSTANLAVVLGVSTRQVRNIKNMMHDKAVANLLRTVCGSHKQIVI